MNLYFEGENSEGRVPEPLSPEQAAVTMLMHATGIRRIDAETVDEFVRRADLYDTYFGAYLREIDGGPVAMTRKILTETMGENTALWTDSDLVTPEEFDRAVRSQKAELRRLGRKVPYPGAGVQ